MKKEKLSKAAKELDKLLFETSQIKLNQKPEELQKDTEEASKELQSDDTITKETLEALTEIWKDRAGELTVKVCDIFRALGILPTEKDEQEEDAEVIPETDDLVEEVDQAERIKDLKDIAKSNDEFKAIRGKLNGYKEIDDLRGAMLAILDGPAEEIPAVKEEAEKEKEAEPAYVKKGIEKKKEEPKATMKIVPKDKPVKKAEKPKVKKQTGITRQTAVFIAVRKVCKKGGSVNDIAEEANSVYMENNPESKGISKLQNMSNVVRHSILALVEFEILTEKNGKYSL